jgi:hypothetical protein
MFVTSPFSRTEHLMIQSSCFSTTMLFTIIFCNGLLLLLSHSLSVLPKPNGLSDMTLGHVPAQCRCKNLGKDHRIDGEPATPFWSDATEDSSLLLGADDDSFWQVTTSCLQATVRSCSLMPFPSFQIHCEVDAKFLHNIRRRTWWLFLTFPLSQNQGASQAACCSRQAQENQRVCMFA